MTTTETTGNRDKTLSNPEFAAELAVKIEKILAWTDRIDGRLELAGKQLDHLDQMIHGIAQFIDEQRPHLERAQALLDPAAAARKLIGRGRTSKGGTGGH